MNKTIKWLLAVSVVTAVVFGAYQLITRMPLGSSIAPGTQIDELNGVGIFYNGGVNQSYGRNLTATGYNLGLRYQCVEFIKRYYYERFGHQMPDSYGHARTFFDRTLPDGGWNKQRALLQYRNGGVTMPAPDDIIVYAPSLFNPYGHVAIIAEVNPYAVVIAQQNAGPVYSSREAIPLVQQGSGYRVDNSRVLGWLRLPVPAD
ncbi:CHAP domain-containing protein [Rheinheimera sp.]|uniref:CHAP domain-containing protein n=1 Tax=Rheinheimera sp. TaxID=1869214 RepID=UPI0027323206|nr:CHAP domain-containing protein [Rheinheimera sp.]MDP2713549.1 CHAP domain-containing protein [Rheinheimera sp.]